MEDYPYTMNDLHREMGELIDQLTKEENEHNQTRKDKERRKRSPRQ